MSQETDPILDQADQKSIKHNTSGLSVPEPNIKTFEQIVAEDKELKFKNYCVNFKDRIEMWHRSHTDKLGNCLPLPLYWDSERSIWVWLNRYQRRS